MSDRKEPRDITAEEAAALSYSQGLKIGNEPGSKTAAINAMSERAKAEQAAKDARFTEHTPRPWEYYESWLVGGPDRFFVSDYAGCGSHEQIIENPYDAALIKNAPDVLAALVKAKALIDILMPGVKHLFDVDFETLNMTCVAVNEAITKATTKEE